MTPVAELKLAHRATWAAGDYAAVARHIDEVPPRDLLSRMDIQPGQRGARRRHRHRQPRDPRRRRRRAGRRPRPHARAVRDGAGARRRPRRRRRLGRGRRRGAALRGRVVRPRAVGLRRAVRAAPRDRRQRARRRDPYRRAHRPRQLDPRGPDRRAVQDHGPLHAGPAGVRLPAAAVGQRRATCAGCSRAAAWCSTSTAATTPGASSRPRPGCRSWRPPTARPSRRGRELTAEGRWEDCRAEMLALAERRNEATDGSLHMEAEYLITIAHKVG